MICLNVSLSSEFQKMVKRKLDCSKLRLNQILLTIFLYRKQKCCTMNVTENVSFVGNKIDFDSLCYNRPDIGLAKFLTFGELACFAHESLVMISEGLIRKCSKIIV